MKQGETRAYRLEKELTQLFDLEGTLDTMLSVSLYYLNQIMDSERSSIWLFQNRNQQLTIYSSLDLEKNEIRIPKSCGVVGWVCVNRKPAVVNNAYEDRRFYRKVDEMTGFHTRNLICTPLFDYKDLCLGALQAINKKLGDYTFDDLELLNLAARIVSVAIQRRRR